MQASCSNCGTQHVLNDAQVAGNSRVQFRCSKCGETSTVEVTSKVESTMVISPLPSFARVEGSGGTRPTAPAQYVGLALPEGATVILTVLSGPSRGHVHKLEKPRVVIGRADADLDLNDPEVSRWHCAIEVKDRIVRLRDLDSTNGTYFEEERVRAAELLSNAEFRVGSSVVRVTVEPK
ncbi:MAG TPA: FHA domain-containing protein [Candidatus Dormibacteraeota bacterium]|nr:FHA domain-containing protein [Candidatus Dormibacteraeota bacterium]